jgi:hypothetical protein
VVDLDPPKSQANCAVTQGVPVALIRRLTWRFDGSNRGGDDRVTDGANHHDHDALRKETTEPWQNDSERLSCSSQLLLSVAVR